MQSSWLVVLAALALGACSFSSSSPSSPAKTTVVVPQGSTTQ